MAFMAPTPHLHSSTCFKLPFLREYLGPDYDMLRARAGYQQDDGFIEECSQFHISFDDIISLPRAPAQLSTTGDNHNLLATTKPEAINLPSVQEGFSFYLSQITNLRNAIRSNMEQGVTPIVDYAVLYQAAEIDAGLREWRSSRFRSDSNDNVGLLYKQMLWIYLWRTIYPLESTSWVPGHKITSAVEDGLTLLKSFPPKDPVQTLLLPPTFIIGCGAFDPAQRGLVRSSIHTIKEYTALKETDIALGVLEQIWKYMDQGDERSWDWQNIAHEVNPLAP
jgi:hypothetical protein